MKKTFLVFALIGTILLCGCNILDVISPPDVEEVPEFTVEVHAILEQREDEVADSLTFGEDLWGIAYTIENTCDEHIYAYVVEFTLVYDTKWASVTQTVEGENLYPGKLDTGWKQLLIADEEPELLDEYTVVLE